MYPGCVRNLIESLKNLPGIGEKSAERMAFSILNFDKDKIGNFITALSEIENIKKCPICNNITDSDKCNICSDESRDNETIFVVEKPKDIVLFEKMGNYNGLYHVLGGLISPMNGIGPDDINLSSLIQRLSKLNNPEVIVALKSTIEGEATTLYIKKVLEGKNVKISRLSYGIPMGMDIDYLDELTLLNALNDRKDIS